MIIMHPTMAKRLEKELGYLPSEVEVSGKLPQAHFRPSSERLKEIAQHGNDLILSATDKELSGFSE